MLESCRITPGRVVEVAGEEATVLARPLVWDGRILRLGDPVARRASWRRDGLGFLHELRPNDWVSLHWDWVCDRLEARQARALSRYTRRMLALAIALPCRPRSPRRGSREPVGAAWASSWPVAETQRNLSGSRPADEAGDGGAELRDFDRLVEKRRRHVVLCGAEKHARERLTSGEPVVRRVSIRSEHDQERRGLDQLVVLRRRTFAQVERSDRQRPGWGKQSWDREGVPGHAVRRLIPALVNPGGELSPEARVMHLRPVGIRDEPRELLPRVSLEGCEPGTFGGRRLDQFVDELVGNGLVRERPAIGVTLRDRPEEQALVVRRAALRSRRMRASRSGSSGSGSKETSSS